MTIRPICSSRPMIDDDAAEAGEQPAAEQHAEQAGAEEARGEAAEHAHAGPVEEAALGGAPAAAGPAIPGLPGWVMVRFIGCAAPGAVVVLGRRRKGPRSPGTGAAATADAGVGRRDRDHQRNRHRQDDGDRPEQFRAYVCVKFMSFSSDPRQGEAPLRWAALPKSEAAIGTHRCGPRSRGCDVMAVGSLPGLNYRLRTARRVAPGIRPVGRYAVMVSLTFATSALSANGFGRKANCSFSGRLLSKASSA